MPTGTNPHILQPRHLPLSGEARKLLWSFYETVELAQASGGELEHIRPTASKAAEQAARIAGVLELWADLDVREVSAVMMECGITLSRYYLGEAKRLIEYGPISKKTVDAERLRKWLTESWPHDEVIPQEILQLGPNALREGRALEAPLRMLVETGHLIKLEAGVIIRGSARKEAYRIVK